MHCMSEYSDSGRGEMCGGFQFLTTVLIKVQFYWDGTPCCLTNSYPGFVRSFCLHLQRSSSPRKLLQPTSGKKIFDSEEVEILRNSDKFYISLSSYTLEWNNFKCSQTTHRYSVH